MVDLSKGEKELVLKGAERTNLKYEHLKQANLLHITSLGSRLVANAIPPVSETITNIRETVSQDCLLSSDELAYIGMSVIINQLEPQIKFTTLAFKIGAAVVDEHNANLCQLAPNLPRRAFIKKLREYKPLRIKKAQRLRIGSLVLAAIESRTNLVYFHKEMVNSRNYRFVSPTDTFIQYADDFMRSSYIRPVRRPIEEFPIPMTDDLIGGYAFDVMNNVAALKYRNKEQIQLINDKGDIEKVKGVLNKVQSVPYCLNQEVLDVAWSLYSNNRDVAGLPGELLEYPKPLLKLATDEEKKEHLRKYGKIKELNNSTLGKRFNAARTLMIAKECAELDHFYFPSYADFRGRIYYHSDYLNPQGGDLAKSLIGFKSKAKIENDFFYFVHGANCYGMDKANYSERYNFIKSYATRIKEIAADPIGNIEWWENADAPFEFLAFCLDCAEYLKDPENYESGLRISSDSTSSGHQILSLLLRDYEGCVRTNVIEGKQDKPADLYSECADIVRVLVQKDADAGVEPAVYWAEFFEGRNLRGLTKRVTMTIVYSLSMYGLRSYVKEWIQENRGQTDYDFFEYDSYLCRRVAEAVEDTVKGSSVGMKYIKEVASIVSKLNKDLEIVFPNGFVMLSSYKRPDSKRIKLKTQKGYLYANWAVPGDKVAAKKAVNASVPNYIHGLDACILYDIVDNVSQALPFSLVHDSVYYRAADVDVFYQQIRSSMKSIFSNDLLLEFKEQIEKQHNTQLPDLPEQGTIDFEEILDSPYIYN